MWLLFVNDNLSQHTWALSRPALTVINFASPQNDSVALRGQKYWANFTLFHIISNKSKPFIEIHFTILLLKSSIHGGLTSEWLSILVPSQDCALVAKITQQQNTFITQLTPSPSWAGKILRVQCVSIVLIGESQLQVYYKFELILTRGPHKVPYKVATAIKPWVKFWSARDSNKPLNISMAIGMVRQGEFFCNVNATKDAFYTVEPIILSGEMTQWRDEPNNFVPWENYIIG